MAEIAGDDIGGSGGEGAIEKLVVIGIGTGVAGGNGFDANGDGEQ